MLFTDVIFAPFLLLTFGAFACAARAPRAQRGVLLVASWVFYGWWDARFLALIAFSTVLDFVVGRRIHASESTGTRRAWLSVSLVGNLEDLGLGDILQENDAVDCEYWGYSPTEGGDFTSADRSMHIDFCGVRGSTPTPGHDFADVGGHTSCVAVSHDGQRPSLVLDAGTGLCHQIAQNLQNIPAPQDQTTPTLFQSARKLLQRQPL